MAKRIPKKPKRPAPITAKVAEMKTPGRKPRILKATEPKPAPKPTSRKTELAPMDAAAATLIPSKQRESLIAWCNLYLGIEGRAGSDNTFLAKKRDLESSLSFLVQSTGGGPSMHPYAGDYGPGVELMAVTVAPMAIIPPQGHVYGVARSKSTTGMLAPR